METDAVRPSDDLEFGVEVIFEFTTRDRAWAFITSCDEAGFKAGFPTHTPNPTDRKWLVRVIRPISAA